MFLKTFAVCSEAVLVLVFAVVLLLICYAKTPCSNPTALVDWGKNQSLYIRDFIFFSPTVKYNVIYSLWHSEFHTIASFVLLHLEVK